MRLNFEIKIVRFRTGEDIICFCFVDYENNKVLIKYPKIFYMDMDYDILEELGTLLISDWMPPEAFPIQETAVPLDSVLFISYPTIEFGYRYLDIIKTQIDPESTLAKDIESSLDVSEEDEVPTGTIH